MKQSSTGARRAKNVPWWNNDCNKARNKAFRKFKKIHSQEALMQHKRAQAIVRRTIRTQNPTFWRQFCSSIGKEVEPSDATIEKKAELLTQTFRKVHSSDKLTQRRPDSAEI